MIEKDNKISVFGSTGFVGSEFCWQYPEIVIPVERNCYSPQSNNILYLISTTDNYNVFDDLHFDINTNLNVLMNVLNKCKDNKDIVFNFISSWFVYGDCYDIPAQETSICNPKGFYSITKKCAEDLLISFCKTFNVSYRIIRLCNVYGEKDKRVSARRNALQYLIGKMARNEGIGLYYGGNFIRDYMHVEDVARAIYRIIAVGEYNKIYNVGGGIPYRFIDLILCARDILGSTSKIENIKPSEFHNVVQVKDMYLGVNKLLGLGFLPQISIRDGIGRICNACK